MTIQGRDVYFMTLAMAKAKAGIRKGQTPFGACLVKKGKVIACAHNVVWATTDITAHAEVNVIRQACRKLKTIDLSGCVIYSTCEPCPMCFSACHWAGIAKIFFGASIADARKAGFREISISNRRMKRLGKSRVHVVANCLRKENVALFAEWRQNGKAKTY